MNVETIAMPKAEAVAKIAAYRKFLKSRANEEYEQALKGYEELAKGTVLVDPFQAIREAGWDDKGRPLLAICRADSKHCWFKWSNDWSKLLTFAKSDPGWGSEHRHVHVSVDNMPLRPSGSGIISRDRAIVPMIPADVYPKRGNGSPKDWYILWEAEWQNVPPKDPLLLKPIGGNLYAVLAAWDLTELERKIIARR